MSARTGETMMNIFFRLNATLALLLGLCGLAQAEPLRVQVYGTHEGPNIVYHYRVINNTDISISNFVIGSIIDSATGEEIPQLERRPAGWSYGRQLETGTEILLAPTSTTQPPYWTAEFYSQQEHSSNYYLEWRIAPNGQPYVVPVGQSLAGFSVSVPLVDNRLSPHEYYNAGQIVDPTKPDIGPDDDRYLRSSFKMSYAVPKALELQTVRGQLEIADTTAPTLSVTLTPATLWPPNGKMVTVNATINVHDDYDPNHKTYLVSITANEPLDVDDIQGAEPRADVRQFQLKAKRDGNNLAGRIYTVTYYARDASGNDVLTRATVTVPHDMGEHEGAEKRDKEDKKGK
jgi:hypothetical protein